MASNLKFLAKVGGHNSVNALMCRFAGNQVSSWHLKKILRKLAWPVAQLSGWHAQIVRWTPDASGSTSMAEKWRFWVVPWCLKFSQSLFISGTTALAGPVWRFFILDETNMAKASGRVDGLLRKRWCVNERHGACRCDSSPGLLPKNWFQTLFSSMEKGCCDCHLHSCTGRYHTIPYNWSAAKESAGQSNMLQTLKWRCEKVFRMQFARGCGWCNQ